MGIRVAWVIYSRHACLLAHEDGREDDLCLLRAGCWLSKLALLVGNLGRRVVGFGLASVGGVRCLFKFPSLFFFSQLVAAEEQSFVVFGAGRLARTCEGLSGISRPSLLLCFVHLCRN